jgi:enamine deaminase RidA (YjgF/YER057c/UK114 family)
MSVVRIADTKLIYIASQVAENTSLDVTGQAREILAFIDRLLAEAGAGRQDIVTAHIYLASVGDYAAMNAVWDDWVVPGHTPARTTLGAKLISSGYKLQMEVTAAVKATD